MEDGIKDKQELLDTLLAVCIGCQDYVFKTITDKMDYAALIKDASMYFNNNVRILDSNGDRVTLLPMVTDAETVEVTKEAFIASVESIKELLVVTNFTIAANLLLDLLGGRIISVTRRTCQTGYSSCNVEPPYQMHSE